MHFVREVGDVMNPKPQENMQKRQEFYPISPPDPPSPPGQPSNQAASQRRRPKRNTVHYALWEGLKATPWTPSPMENVQKCQEFYHFRGRAALTVLCFNMRLNYKISTRVILIFLPLYLPSSSTLLMGAGAVYFIKILHQHFDDNDLWKKWFNFSCNNSSRAGTWNLQQDCHKEAYMNPSSK